MSRKRKLEFEAADEEFVSCGTARHGHKHNVKFLHHITPEEFIRTYEDISNRYNLDVTEYFLERFTVEGTAFGKKQKAQVSPIAELINFILDINYFLGKQTEVSPLIKEFNEVGDFGDLQHVCSLALLTSAYASRGYNIEFLRKSKEGKTPDLHINGIPADVKVRRQADIGAIHLEKGNTYATKLGDDLCFDIGNSIQNRLYDGIKQAELVFVDLGRRSLPFMVMWDDD